jgi:long-chain acyl-CoA synthetase
MLTDRIRFNRVIFRNEVFASGYLEKTVDSVAHHLDDRCRSNSPIVYLLAPNHIKTVIAFLGILKSGRTCLLVDPKTGTLEYEEMLADTQPSAVVRIDDASIEFDFAREFAFTDFRMEPALVSQLDDVCIMLYTAAEDGYAKAAMLTHANVLSNALAIANENRTDESSVSCSILPLHHLFGFQNGALSPLVAGGSFLICDISDMQKTATLARDLLQYGVSHIYSVPLMYYLLSKSAAIHEIGRRVYSMISGGYKSPSSLRDRFESRLHIPLYEGYGLTEASPVCTWQCKTKKYDKTSLGLPMVDYRVKITDASGRDLPCGEKGEICFRGGNVMKGYFKYPEATAHALEGGWLHTGDYGTLDPDGNVFFLGVKKNMFNVAGKKVYPEEVRRLMMRNENVENAELRSDYDPLTGDRIKARITLKHRTDESKKDFLQWCANSIGHHKIPQNISFGEE